MLKIYSQYHGWRGIAFVIAESEEEARAIMEESCANHDADRPVEAETIEKGWVGSFDAS